MRGQRAAAISRGRRSQAKGKTMKALVQRVKSFFVSEDGPTATEYAVMLALIIVACIAAITALGTALRGTFENLSGNLPDGNPS
jgi:pilus assembly protein Flp/PilA